MQTFKPGVTVVEHRYRPLVGHFMFSQHDGKWDDYKTPDPNKFVADYCIDDAKSHVLRAMVRLSDGGYLTAESLGYILTTGANWAGPIGTFHLVVDGEHTLLDNGKVGAILLCSDVPLKQTGSRHLEGIVQNYVPQADLKLLMVLEPLK